MSAALQQSTFDSEDLRRAWVRSNYYKALARAQHAAVALSGAIRQGCLIEESAEEYMRANSHLYRCAYRVLDGEGLDEYSPEGRAIKFEIPLL